MQRVEGRLVMDQLAVLARNEIKQTRARLRMLDKLPSILTAGPQAGHAARRHRRRAAPAASFLDSNS
jgi:hypothetical protein